MWTWKDFNFSSPSFRDAKKKPLLLLPASLRDKTKEEAEEYRKHFTFNVPKILSYEKLSRASGKQELEEYAPDLIICDEAHHIKDLFSTRTKRLGRYLYAHSSCSFVCMSGTLFNRSLEDFAHLSDWCLEEGSPLPRNSRDVIEFDAVLKGEANTFQYARFKPLLKLGDNPKHAFYTRLKSTQGVIITEQETVKASIIFHLWRLKVPSELKKSIDQCFYDGVIPALSELDCNLDLDKLTASDHLWSNQDSIASRLLTQMLSGLVYFWDWENNDVNYDWLNARRTWNSAVNFILDLNMEKFDSRFLIESQFYELPQDLIEDFEPAFKQWQGLKHIPPPPTSLVWVSDYMIDSIKEWVHKQKKPFIIWVNLTGVGQRLEQELNIPYIRKGEPPREAQSCILSIKSHGTGKNLQHYSNNLIIHPIANPATFEQLLARTHREGQMEDEVHFTLFTHSVFGSALHKSTKQAYIIQNSTKQQYRLCYADRIKYNGT